MRILFFSTAFPQPQDPHRAPYNLQRCRALADVHQVAIVSPRRWTDRLGGPTRRTGDPDLTKTFAAVEYPTYVYTPGMLHGQHARFLRWSCGRRALAVARRVGVDVVLSYWTFPDGAAAQRIARRAGVPAVAIVGGSDVLMSHTDTNRLARIARVLADADAVITVSADLRSRICALGVQPSRVHILPPGVDRGRFSPGNRLEARRRLGLPLSRPVMLWVGRMVPVKNVAALVDAFAALARDGRECLLCLVGDGPLEPALRQQVAARALTDRVRFVGPLRPAALPDWYRAADVTVCPSISEGTPNVLLESIACGTRFVASDVGGIAAIATRGLDALVPVNDVDALHAALRIAIDEPAPPVRRRVLPESWRHVADATAQVLADAVGRTRADRRASGTRLALLGSVLASRRILERGAD